MTPALQPPVARRIPRTVTMHGDTRDDPYYWLRDRANPEVIEYLSAENAYLEHALEHTRPLQDQIYTELRARIKEVDSSVPVQRDDYFYYTRMEQGKQYPIHCRRRGGMDA